MIGPIIQKSHIHMSSRDIYESYMGVTHGTVSQMSARRIVPTYGKFGSWLRGALSNVYVCIHIYMCVYICIYIYIYMCTQIHISVCISTS